ncbi:hypothetical protein FACS1894176_06050 [Bacteroidia bacterium]|nr:hypothetical protein FACS1894176_06050 [Bacteroidia bacterium]
MADEIRIDPGRYGIDHNKKLVIVNQAIDWLNQNTPQKDAIFIDDKHYTIENPINNLQVGIPYSIKDTDQNRYTLYFTELPLIHIATENTIVDEPKVAATFTIAESTADIITSDIGIEYRGGTSQLLPKKSFKIGFWQDNTGTTKKDVQLLGMRSDNKWDLQAMAIQPLKVRSKTNFDIWRKINSLHYQSSEPEAVNSSRWEYAELFLNGEYRGVYGVSEPVDRKQLKLKKTNEETGMRGELYKGNGWGATIFSSCPPYDNNSLLWVNNNGSGFEWQYPDEIDYFIFINSIIAVDNTGHNLFIAKYNANEPYFYVPWDLDSTVGLDFDGSLLAPDKLHVSKDLLKNNMYRRLLLDNSAAGFQAKLKTKWLQLRNDWLTVPNIMNLYLENYNYLLRNGVYEREMMAWDNYHFDPQHLEYMTNYLTDRIHFLDQEFASQSSDISTIGKPKDYTNVDVSIYNITGQLLKMMHFDEISNESLSPSLALQSGIYILKIQNIQRKETRKIIIP